MIDNQFHGLLSTHQNTAPLVLAVLQNADISNAPLLPLLVSSSLIKKSFSKDKELGALRV
jgi:hypothetical protein